MKEYLNSSGKWVVISEMPTPYLINAFKKHLKEYKRLLKLKTKSPNELKFFKKEKGLVKDLLAEIKTRGIDLTKSKE